MTMMATDYKVGDRVRLVHEGVVTALTGTDDGRAVVIDGNARLLGKGETVEVLERAAVAVGTLVSSGRLLAFKTKKGWVRDDGSLSVHGDGIFTRNYKPVYEPTA